MNAKPISYLQTDKRWANVDYSAPGEKTTIGASGCGPTAMAMVLATWCDKNVTPKTECAWAKKKGFKAPHSGTYYGYFPPAGERYGLEVVRLNWSSLYGNPNSSIHAQAKKAIENGDLVIACMGPGRWTSSGHYVLVYDIQGNTIYINDPASTKTIRTKGDYSLFKKQVKYYWVIKRPENMKPVEPAKPDQEEGEEMTVYYEKLEDIPVDHYDAVKKLVDKGVLKGTGTGLHLTYDMLRIFTILDRAGAFD